MGELEGDESGKRLHGDGGAGDDPAGGGAGHGEMRSVSVFFF